MTIWRYEEKGPAHTLVKFYREKHGEGVYLGELDEAAVRAMIAELNPKGGVDQAMMQLEYFGFVPILVLNKKQ